MPVVRKAKTPRQIMSVRMLEAPESQLMIMFGLGIVNSVWIHRKEIVER